MKVLFLMVVGWSVAFIIKKYNKKNYNIVAHI